MKVCIFHGDTMYEVPVKDGASWTTERKGFPGKFTFTLICDEVAKFEEGDAVSLTDGNDKVFYGFIFSIKGDETDEINITAYDQLRYFKNKHTLSYKGIYAHQVLQRVATAFNLKLGVIEQTTYALPETIEEDSALFDIVLNALDAELMNAGKLFVLYDDYGSITLKSLESMRTDVFVDASCAEKHNYSSDIDNKVYNRIKLTRENEQTGMVDNYVVQDGGNINRWGILQHTEKLKEGENGAAKAEALLKLYNVKNKSLKIKNCKSNLKVRAGCLVIVNLTLNDGTKLQQYMLVESCKHTFGNGNNTMDLTLKGGVINA